MDTGSGAAETVAPITIQAVKDNLEYRDGQMALIVGGGINTVQQMKEAFDAGADIAVVGSILITNPERLIENESFMFFLFNYWTALKDSDYSCLILHFGSYLIDLKFDVLKHHGDSVT